METNKKSVFNNILKAEIILKDKTYFVRSPPKVGYILNRQEFIYQLGKQAEKLGVIIQTNDKIKSAEDLDTDYIVGASGCPSTIKRSLGIDKGIKGFSYQQTLEHSNCFISDTIKLFFTGTTGYYWIFPRNPEKSEVNVGVGVLNLANNITLKDLLESFKDKQGIKGKINYVTGGLIPGGLQKPLKYNNILFVGDAGVGHTRL